MARQILGFVYGFMAATAVAIYLTATDGEAKYFD